MVSADDQRIDHGDGRDLGRGRTAAADHGADDKGAGSGPASPPRRCSASARPAPGRTPSMLSSRAFQRASTASTEQQDHGDGKARR